MMWWVILVALLVACIACIVIFLKGVAQIGGAILDATDSEPPP